MDVPGVFIVDRRVVADNIGSNAIYFVHTLPPILDNLIPIIK